MQMTMMTMMTTKTMTATALTFYLRPKFSPKKSPGFHIGRCGSCAISYPTRECAQTMHLMRRTDGAIIICQAPRPSDPAVALRISFAREVTPWITAPKVVRSKLG